MWKEESGSAILCLRRCVRQRCEEHCSCYGGDEEERSADRIILVCDVHILLLDPLPGLLRLRKSGVGHWE